jgi:DNA-binding XRE family transcriptional regulator
MPITLEEMIASLPLESQARIEAQTQRMIDDYETLQAIRKAHKHTQKALAEKLGVKQVTISKIENKADMLITTLGSYIEAMGGKLNLVAEFPNKPAINIKLRDL